MSSADGTGARMNKLTLAVILVFVFCLLAFSVELVYLLWYRRRFPRRRIPSSAADMVDDPELNSGGAAETCGNLTSCKEHFFHFLCWKNQCRVEPAAAAVAPPEPGVAGEKQPAVSLPSAAAEEVELAKWRALYASRVLFTIREEEKEGAESDGGGGTEEETAAEVVGPTPFSTPCDSPLFYTPAASPRRDAAAPASANPEISTGDDVGDDYSPGAGED